jgi:hypothetical protein
MKAESLPTSRNNRSRKRRENDAGKTLHQLTYAEGLPTEALKAASDQRVEMVPLFVQEIQHFLSLDPGARAKSTSLFFIFHLLGEWRGKSRLSAPGSSAETSSP